MTKPHIRVGGFFSGIGSHLSACKRLASEADWEFVFQCEFDERTAKASDLIHGELRNLGDIKNVHDIGGELAVDLLVFTPPCQDISVATAGKAQGNSKGTGTRSSLVWEVPRILANTPKRERPKYLVMEEVPTMIKRYEKNFRILLDELSELGYFHRWGIINATDCGIPQHRERAFLISKLGGEPPQFPEPIPLTTCMADYLEPEPVADHYYLSEERKKGLLWSNEKEEEAGRGFRFRPLRPTDIARTISTKGGGRKTDNFLVIE